MTMTRRIASYVIGLSLLGPMGVGCERVDPQALAFERAAAERSAYIGQRAPSFSMVDQNGHTVSLDDYRGRWLVLYFYPKDDTPACTCQANEFTELLFRFRDMNAEVVGVSEDSPKTHRYFAEKHGLEITLLSDPTHKTMTRYGAWTTHEVNDKTFERVIRSTFLIGPDGIIRYHWPEVIPQGHAERVRLKLAELRSSASTTTISVPQGPARLAHTRP